MRRLFSGIRFSFQTRVLLPVVTVMILLLVITLYVVNQRITAQLQNQAAQTLAAADAALRNSQQIRARNLIMRYRNVSNEPRFKAVTELADPKTLRFLLSELLEEDGGAVALFTTEKGQLLASAGSDVLLNTAEFETHAATSIKQGLEGQPNVDLIQIGKRLFDVVSVAVVVRNEVVGALTFGTEVGAAGAEEFKRITHGEIVLLSDQGVVASTLSRPELNGEFAARFAKSQARQHAMGTANTGNPEPIMVGDEHFLGVAGQFQSLDGDSTIGYLLLSSYEQPLRTLRNTQSLLLGVSLAGICLATACVWMLIRRTTAPLRDLRDSAEAVGQGDFSQRVEVTSRDECGELAVVFNQMTENLQISHEQLEKTVETLKNTQAQLVHSEKLAGIGEFVAGVTHELNNPLTTVIGFAELLQQSSVDERQKRFLECIVTSAQRCHKIVQSLLSFARQHKAERKPVRLHDLIHATLNILQYQLRTNNITVTTDFEPDLPKVMGDPHQLQQVFLNIINNARQAIEASRPKGAIRISSEKVGGSVRVKFQDDGPGISQENLAKIFNPFFTTKDVGKGTGLGLSLSYGIIKAHGGGITAQSEHGQGATFIIELPAALASEDTAPTLLPAPGPVAVEGQGKRALVVDDEDSILELVREALTEHGFQLDVASDGETALRQLRANHYHLTVCDWKMPGLNGQQVYERLRSFDPEAAARVIFITGDVINQAAQDFIRQQGNVCLSKPFSLDEFRSAVGKVLKAA